MSNKLLSTTPWAPHFAAFLLRVIVGGLMLTHGYDKVMNYSAYSANFGDIIGIGAKLSFNLVVFAEFVCAILLILGLFTRLAVIPILITMAVAFFVAHKNDPFMMKTLPFLYMLLCLPVFVLGSGKYSVDRLFFKS